MYFPPSRLEARDALEELAKRAPQRGPPTPTPLPRPGDEEEEDEEEEPVNPIESWFSVILNGGNPLDPSSPTLSATSTTSRLTSSTSTSRVSTSTRSSTPIQTPTPETSSPRSTSSTPRSTATITTVIGNENDNVNQANDSATNKGLPSVVIGVIVAAAVIFGLIFIALIARKFFQARRRRRRATWADPLSFDPANNMQEKALPPPPPAEAQEYTNSVTYPAYPPAAVTFANTAPYTPAATAPFAAPYPFGGASAISSNANANNRGMFNSSAYAPTDLAGPVVITQTPPTPSTTASASNVREAIVKRTFVPALQDELSISNGDRVRVLSAYDDGWALCEKVATGEQGVVPQECLDTSAISSSSMNQNTPAQQLASNGEGSGQLDRSSSLRRNQGQIY